MGTITLTDGTSMQVELEAFANAKCFFKRKDIKAVVLPEGLKTIRKESFSGCTALEEVTIPYGVTSIEPEAFMGCCMLRHVELPASLKILGKHSFAFSGLQSVDLPSRLKTVDAEVFFKCPDLVTLTVPEDYRADSIGVYADKVENLICPPELDHLLEFAPHSPWYYSLSIKSLSQAREVLDDDQAFETPVLIYFYSGVLLGPFFSPKPVFTELKPLLEKYISTIEKPDIELLAANIAIEPLDDPESEEYRINRTEDEGLHPEVRIFRLDGYDQKLPIFLVECEEEHDSSFHSNEVIYGAFCSLEAAETMAGSLMPYYSYPITRNAPTIRIWNNKPSFWGNDYVHGYDYASRYSLCDEDDSDWDDDEEEEDEDIQADDIQEEVQGPGYSTLYIPLMVKTDPAGSIKVKGWKAFADEAAARALMWTRLANETDVIGADLQALKHSDDPTFRLQDGSLIQHSMVVCRIDEDLRKYVGDTISIVVESEYRMDAEAVVLTDREPCAFASDIEAGEHMQKLYRKKLRAIKAHPEMYGETASKVKGFYGCTICQKDSSVIQYTLINVTAFNSCMY